MDHGGDCMRLSVRTCLTGIVTLSLMTTAVAGFQGLSGTSAIRNTIQKIYSDEFLPIEYITDVEGALISCDRDMLVYALSDKTVGLETLKERFPPQIEIMRDRFTKLSRMNNLAEEEKNLVRQLTEQLAGLSLPWEQACTLSDGGRDREAKEVIHDNLQPALDTMSTQIAHFIEIQERQAREAGNLAAAVHNQTRVRIAIIVFVAMAASLLTNFTLSRRIVGSLNEVTWGAEEIGNGNLQYRVSVGGLREFSQLAVVFNRMVTRLSSAEEGLRSANRELEQKVQERTKELAQKNEDLRKEIDEKSKAQQALADSSERFKLFTYSVMHDLKSPAIGIHGIARLLQKSYGHLLDERGAAYCEQLAKSSKHIGTFIEELNTYIASREAPMTPEEVCLEEVAQSLHDEFGTILSQRNIRWQDGGFRAKIVADKLSIIRVLRNFVENAIKYGGDKLSEIKLDYQRTETHHILSVRDNGVGIDEQECSKVFDVFHRGEKSKGVPGTGLGLAIVKEIAERHGGSSWATPGVEGGVGLYVSLAATPQGDAGTDSPPTPCTG